ncbi:oligosaccharide flippase family protein [Rhodovulum sulfidophilum]|uniref:oligosaccharide flippase family protein n=1 Tax=Rhodovulum sulfidophilum TaxID=35806 RepID=UPI001928C816|nr:oligosaccharide flippase family protein [Rhodovulum sulfidophilum]
MVQNPQPETGLKKRAMRGTVFSLAEFGAANLLRLVSNLILTRLLFPEAFGLMAIVQVFMTGLQMFSDVGIRTSITLSKSGDDPDYLNTAWTVQILRGAILWLAAFAISGPVADFYDEPLLAQLLPVVALNALFAGFMSTNMATANRHLRLGRQTALNIGSQVLALALNIVLAFWLRSVWALIWGGLASTLFMVVASHTLMPGIRNRLRWHRASLGELIRFGKWIFVSTIAGFLVNQADRAILGKFITLDKLGVYTIAFFFGSLPVLMARATLNRILGPLYRMRPPAESAANRRNVLMARRLAVGGLVALTVPLAYGGIFLIETLYDPRYALAGPMVVLFALATPAQLVSLAYGAILLASGDSRRQFHLVGLTAAIQIPLLLIGVMTIGIPGVILAPALAALLVYPLRTRYLRLYNADDPLTDLAILAVSLILNGHACWLAWDRILPLLG